MKSAKVKLNTNNTCFEQYHVKDLSKIVQLEMYTFVCRRYSYHIWCSDGVQMVFMWCSYGVNMVFMWCSYGVHMVFMWCSCGVHVVFMWCSCGVHIVFIPYIRVFTLGQYVRGSGQIQFCFQSYIVI